jgi:hypothetical protein
MQSATIKLYLPQGDAKGLRTAEVSNWSGKAIAAPRTELEALLGRPELDGAGVYILSGTDPSTNSLRAYIGEAEVIRERLKQHKSVEFWVMAVVFVSKDENLTKAHVRFLEERLIKEARQVGRFALDQNESPGSRLPESDRQDMDVFFSYIRLLLPVLGSELLTPLVKPQAKSAPDDVLYCRIKGLEARGQRTASGFVVFRGSLAVLEDRPSAQERHPSYVVLRKQLRDDGSLVQQGNALAFSKDVEFSSPSAAAAVVHGGGANGLTEWKLKDGRNLKQIEEMV